MSNITKISAAGMRHVIDLEVNHPDHQFYLASGILTSNSHSISYAYDSYMCAWLLYHYRPQWLCAYMESMVGNPEDRARAIAEAKSLGFEVTKIDINESGRYWRALSGNRLVPSLSSAKGIGEAVIDEIETNRPYFDIHDFLWKRDGTWKHSKLNKRVLDVLIKVGALDSFGAVGADRMFANYRHMHSVIVERNAEIRHPKRGKEAFERLLTELRDTSDWTPADRVKHSVELIGGFDVSLLIPAKIAVKLSSMDVVAIDNLVGQRGIVWFVAVESSVRMTKRGKPYVFAKVVGSTGKELRLFVWDARIDSVIETYAPYIASIERSDFGFSTRMRDVRRIGENANGDGMGVTNG